MAKAIKDNLIFVSFSTKDVAFAKRFSSDLINYGANIWISFEEIKDDYWDLQVEDALNFCNTVIVILSPNSVRSHNVRDELSKAVARKKRILPIVIQQCEIPIFISRLHYYNFEGNYEDCLLNFYPAVKPKMRLWAILPRPRISFVISFSISLSLLLISIYSIFNITSLNMPSSGIAVNSSTKIPYINKKFSGLASDSILANKKLVYVSITGQHSFHNPQRWVVDSNQAPNENLEKEIKNSIETSHSSSSSNDSHKMDTIGNKQFFIAAERAVNKEALFTKSSGSKSGSNENISKDAEIDSTIYPDQIAKLGDDSIISESLFAKTYKGEGKGGGTLVELSLRGWKWVTRPIVIDKSDETGTITFRVAVDRNGHIKNIVTVKTTVTDYLVVNQYRNAIRKLTFIPNSLNVPNDSIGTLTFKIR